MRALHVAVVQRALSLRRGEPWRSAARLCLGLLARGHRVTVVGETIDPALVAEFEFVPVPVEGRTDWARERSFLERAVVLVRELEPDTSLGIGAVPEVDVVCTSGATLPRPAASLLADGWRRRIERRHPAVRAEIELDRLVFGELATARWYVVASHHERRRLVAERGIDEGRVAIVPPGVDRLRFDPGWRTLADAVRRRFGVPAGNPLLACGPVAELDPDELRCATDVLRRLRHRATRMVLIDSDETRRRAAACTRSQGLPDRVLLVDERDAHRLLAASDLFVLPLLDGSFPGIVLESLASGTPVVVPRDGGAADVVVPGVNGELVDDPADVPALVEAVDRYLDLPEERRRAIEERCAATANRLTLAVRSIHFETLLREACEQRVTIPIAPFLTPRIAERRAA